MDIHLTDLDALALRVREPRSRDYLVEAIRCYRAGAYKAAIVATYVAVTYDIVMKVRELANAGDGSATAFVQALDNAVVADNRRSMLDIEGSLIKEAHDTFQFLGPQEFAQIDRLKEDRHRCAHPAFATESELFQPTPELVRAHIVHAVTLLLSQPPVQGKTALEAFAADVASASFPSDNERAVQYVTARYLERMRPNLITNLATVIIKGLVRQNVPGWEGKDDRLLNALSAIARARPDIWDGVVRDVPTRLLPGLNDDQRLRAFQLFRFEPRFWHHADGPTKAQFAALLDNMVVGPDQVVAFSAISIEELREPMLQAFGRADRQRKLAIISRFPHPFFLDKAIEVLSGAGDFRGAEGRFQGAIAPMIEFVDEAAAARILDVTMENGQIWHAGGIPEMLADLASVLARRGKLDAGPWSGLVAFYRERRQEYAAGLLAGRLRDLGVDVPVAPPEQEQD